MNLSDLQSRNQSTRSRRLRAGATLASLLVIAWLVWDAWDEIVRALSDMTPGLLALSVALGLLFSAIQGFFFAILVARYGDAGPKWRTVCAYLLSQPSKYVPGKVWPVFVQSAVIGPRAQLMPVTIANVELFLVNLLHLAALGFLCLEGFTPVGITVALIVGPLAGALIMRVPTSRLVRRLMPSIARRIGILPSNNPEGDETIKGAGTILLSMLANLVASYLVLVAAVGIIPSDQVLGLLSVLYLSNVAGSLVFLIPAGLGVRELAAAGLGAIMLPGTPASAVVTAALVFRLWQILVDAASFTAGALALRLDARNSA